MSTLSLRNVSLTYPGAAQARADILHSINLSLDEREFVIVIGRSGSGKTSLLNLAAGFLKPTRGSITIDGKEITGAECKVDNDRGAWSLKSGEVGNVRRSSKDLNIVCTDPQNPEAKARAISRANGGMFGNMSTGAMRAAGAVGALAGVMFLLGREVNKASLRAQEAQDIFSPLSAMIADTAQSAKMIGDSSNRAPTRFSRHRISS